MKEFKYSLNLVYIMAKIDGNKIILNKDEIELIKNIEEFEIIPNKKGIFLLIDKNIKSINNDELISKENNEEKNLLKKIKEKKLSELVEGKFENTLNENEKKILEKLLIERKVLIFKLSESYKKGVYRINENNETTKKFDSEKFTLEKKHLPDYELENDGFVATTNLERAKILSAEHKERIEEGELRGIKSFEGIYYLIQNELLENYIIKVLKIFNEKNKIGLEELAQKTNASIELIKIVCEFLKEDGELLEKTKAEYTHIK